MANKLKNIFSNNPPEYKSTVKFRSNDAYRNFRAALDVVERDGAIVPKLLVVFPTAEVTYIFHRLPSNFYLLAVPLYRILLEDSMCFTKP